MELELMEREAEAAQAARQSRAERSVPPSGDAERQAGDDASSTSESPTRQIAASPSSPPPYQGGSSTASSTIVGTQTPVNAGSPGSPIPDTGRRLATVIPPSDIPRVSPIDDPVSVTTIDHEDISSSPSSSSTAKANNLQHRVSWGPAGASESGTTKPEYDDYELDDDISDASYLTKKAAAESSSTTITSDLTLSQPSVLIPSRNSSSPLISTTIQTDSQNTSQHSTPLSFEPSPVTVRSPDTPLEREEQGDTPGRPSIVQPARLDILRDANDNINTSGDGNSVGIVGEGSFSSPVESPEVAVDRPVSRSSSNPQSRRPRHQRSVRNNNEAGGGNEEDLTEQDNDDELNLLDDEDDQFEDLDDEDDDDDDDDDEDEDGDEDTDEVALQAYTDETKNLVTLLYTIAEDVARRGTRRFYKYHTNPEQLRLILSVVFTTHFRWLRASLYHL
jgi:hypothetical protein